MKKTIVVFPNSNQHKAVEALMNDLGFKEVERYVTGGLHSSIEIVLTFEGDEQDYHENNYVKFLGQANEDQIKANYCYWFSLGYTDGYFTNDIEMFKSVIAKSKVKPEIHSF